MEPLHIGRVFGFPVYIGWSAFLVLAFLVFGRGGGSAPELAQSALYAIAVFLSVLVHELGHAVAGERLGLRPVRILLHGFGGFCEYGRSPRAREGFLSSAAGPAAGLALGAAVWGLTLAIEGFVPPQIAWLLHQVVWINVFWSLFNLLPMWPLDGGHVLWHALRMRLQGRRAWSIVRGVGLAVAVLVAGAGWISGSTFLIVIAGLSVLELLQR